MIFEDDEISGFEKSKLPYSLLLDPVTDMAAAYTSNHRLITESASETLIEFARNNVAQQEPWDKTKHDPTSPWRPLPAWATAQVLDRCVLLWIKRGNAPDSYWRSIPRK